MPTLNSLFVRGLSIIPLLYPMDAGKGKQFAVQG